jgi:hypothetical protein
LDRKGDRLVFRDKASLDIFWLHDESLEESDNLPDPDILIEVKLFGSKATGKDQPDSDIDVLVAVEDGGVEIEDQVLDMPLTSI